MTRPKNERHISEKRPYAYSGNSKRVPPTTPPAAEIHALMQKWGRNERTAEKT